LDKTPISKNGCKDATLDEQQIRKWWTTFPEANIGLATGYDFFVIDIDPDGANELLVDHPGSVAISARTGEGVADMLRTLADRLRGLSTITELLVPFDRGDLLAALHREGEVLVETATEDGMLVRARLDEVSVSRLHEFVVSGQTLRS
jgi:hypothetical protein